MPETTTERRWKREDGRDGGGRREREDSIQSLARVLFNSSAPTVIDLSHKPSPSSDPRPRNALINSMADSKNPLVVDEETIADEHRESDSEEEPEDDQDGENGLDTPGAGSSTSASASKKKKKKRSKAAKILASLRPGKDAIPQSLVDKVMARVKEEHGENAPGTDEEQVRRTLEELKIMDVIKGKAGVAGRGKKDMGAHKVCVRFSVVIGATLKHSTAVLGDAACSPTRYLPQCYFIFTCIIIDSVLGEGPPIEDGYIEQSILPDLVRQEPYPLPKDFEWSVVDLNDAAQVWKVHPS